jgi:sn-glycerol 3-phosphate transport system ATP-binding protein
MATVTIESVSQSYGAHAILHDVNLKIEKGEFVVIVGPSGCGKTTLLRLIAGLDTVLTGSIMINDRCVNKTPPSSRDIAMVFQNYALYPHMSVYDNMAYGLKMRKMNKKLIKERVDMAGKMLQLTDCMQRKPNALSGGQRQRVAMGRAIVRSPAVFLFDEPLSNLDFKLRTEMRHEIKKLHQQLNATCIYVTHDQTEAMTMATKVVVLNNGKVEQVGTPRMVYDSPDSIFVASFLGHFPMNFMPACLDESRSCIVLSAGLELPIPNFYDERLQFKHIVVGVRPEHMNLTEASDCASVSVVIERIDDMGADKLLLARTEKSREQIMIRVSGDACVREGQNYISFNRARASVFCPHSGKRIGGWSEGK